MINIISFQCEAKGIAGAKIVIILYITKFTLAILAKQHQQ